MVKESTSRAADLGSIPALGLDLFLGRAIPVTEKLVIQWLSYQALDVIRSALGLGWPVFGILLLGEIEILICYFCLSVAARTNVRADPYLRYTSVLLGC